MTAASPQAAYRRLAFSNKTHYQWNSLVAPLSGKREKAEKARIFAPRAWRR